MPAACFGLGRSNGDAAISTDDINESTPWIAAADGNLALMQAALSHLELDAANAADENGYTLLQAAASYSHVHILEWLLSRPGIDIQQEDSDGDTALHHAGTADAARLLVQAGAMVPATNDDGKTALQVKQDELQDWMQESNDDGLQDEDHEEVTKLRALIDYLASLPAVRAQ